jgi:putative redox protein
MIHVEVSLVSGEYGFEAADAYGHTVRLDTSPMQMLLMGLGGCSGIDVVSILKKQRQTVEGFRMIIDGEREKGVEPSLWTDIKVIFELKGRIDPEKARRACELSMEKYCSVAATLRKAGCRLEWESRVVE